MSSAPLPPVPPLWRERGAGVPARQAGARRRRALAVLLVLALLGGLVVALLYPLRPPAAAHFACVCVTSYRDSRVPPPPFAARDRDALLQGGLFASTSEAPGEGLAQMLQALTALAERPAGENLVLYVGGNARTDAEGHVHLLPATADLGDPTTWLPLRRVLELLRRSPARNKLLVLDVGWPLASPALGTLRDDVPAQVEADLAAVEDARRLVLCPCGPGQVSLASEAKGRSVFGLYLEEGLRKAQREGPVSVRELADFVRDRVDGWARRNRQRRQVPVLLGSGRDFVVAMRPGEPPPVAEVAEAAYPDWLRKAWTSAPANREAWEALVVAERDWRAGAPAEGVREACLARLAGLRRAASPAPPPFALAQASAGPANRGLVEDVRQRLSSFEAKTRGLSPGKTGPLRDQLAGDFLAATKGRSAEDVSRAVLEAAADEPSLTAEAVRFLDALLRSRAAKAQFVETAWLRLLAELADGGRGKWQGDLARRSLEVALGGERAAARARTFPWVRRPLEEAADRRHRAEMALSSPGLVPPGEAEAWLRGAADDYQKVMAQQDVVAEALTALDEARLALPFYLPYLEHGTPSTEAAWLAAAREGIDLAGRLGKARPGAAELADLTDELRRRSALLRAGLAELRRPFAPEAVALLLREAGRPGASPRTWWELDGLLATPFLRAEDRRAVWQAARDLAERLERDDRAPAPFPSPGEGVEQATALRRAGRAFALARLLGAEGPEVEKAGQGLATRQGKREQLEAVAVVARRQLIGTGQQGPANEEAELWGWLAERYRYLAREHGPGSTLGELYARAATGFRPWLRAGDSELEITPVREPALLLPGQSGTLELDVRPVVPAGGRPTVELEVLAPPGLTASPARRELASPGVSVTPRGAYRFPATIGRSALPPSPPFETAGVMVRGRLAGRTYHRKVPLALRVAGPDIVLSANPKGPEPALSEVRLRAVKGPQPVHVYLRNNSGRDWEKLTVQLVAGGDLVGVAGPLSLKRGAVAPVAFKAPPAPPPPIGALPPVAAPAPVVALLPALRRPLVVRVLDADAGTEPVSSRTLKVEIAAPREYVEVTGAEFAPAGPAPGPQRNRLAVRLRVRDELPPPACTATLTFAPDAEGRVARHREGTLHGALPAKGEELTLTAEGVEPPGAGNRPALLHVAVDGWARAFAFELAPTAAGRRALVRRLDGPTLRLGLASDYGLAGPAFRVPIEADNAPEGATVEVKLGRIIGGAFRVEAEGHLDAPRGQRIGLDPRGADGALVFEASVSDGAVELDTRGMRGPRELRARLLNRAGGELAFAARRLVLGESAPAEVRFVGAPAKAWRMAPVALRARGSDPVAGIKEAHFFVGQPADGKVPAGAKTTPGTALDKEKTTWGAKLPLPADRKGPLDVSVRFVNGLGLSTFATTTLELVEVDPGLTAPGKIVGKVSYGTTPQQGLEVILRDDKGAQKGKTATKADGGFAFNDVPPGRYRVSSTKRPYGYAGQFPRKNDEFIVLKPGATAEAEVTLFLPAGP